MKKNRFKKAGKRVVSCVLLITMLVFPAGQVSAYDQFNDISQCYSFRNYDDTLSVYHYRAFFSNAQAQTLYEKYELDDKKEKLDPHGLCSGFVNTVTSYAMYDILSQYESKPDQVSDLKKEDWFPALVGNTASYIKYGYAYQNTVDFSQEKKDNKILEKDIADKLPAFIEEVRNSSSPMYISVHVKSGKKAFGHALLTTGRVTRVSDGCFQIEVYDCNRPTSLQNITVNLDENSSYTTGASWEYGSTYKSDDDDTEVYITWVSDCNLNFARDLNNYISEKSDSRIELYAAVFNINTSGGKLTWADYIKLFLAALVYSNYEDGKSYSGIIPITTAGADIYCTEKPGYSFWLNDYTKPIELSDLDPDTDASMAYGNDTLEVSSKASSDMKIDISNVEATVSPKSRSKVSITYKDSYEVDKAVATTISSNTSDTLAVKSTGEGVVLSGVDNAEVSVTEKTYEDDGLDKKKFDKVSVDGLDSSSDYLVKTTGTGNDTKIEVYQDSDGNGSFDEEIKTSRIFDASTISLEPDHFTYNKKARKVSVFYMEKELVNGVDYNITYKNNKNIGTAKAAITGLNEYSGSVTKSFKINPRATSIKKAKAGKKSISVSWKKAKDKVSGYQIQCSQAKDFSAGVKKITAKSTKAKIKKLKSKKKYYVRIRTYKTVKGKKYYSNWSKVKSVKVK